MKCASWPNKISHEYKFEDIRSVAFDADGTLLVFWLITVIWRAASTLGTARLQVKKRVEQRQMLMGAH